MKLIKATLLATALVTAPLAYADAEATAQAEQLLDVVGIETTLNLAVTQMVEAQLQQNPNLAPFRGIMQEFFSEYAGYQSLKPAMVEAYANAFTASELEEMNAFYGSDVGQKAVQTMPKIMREVAQTGMVSMQANMGELQAKMQAEAQRLEASQTQEQ